MAAINHTKRTASKRSVNSEDARWRLRLMLLMPLSKTKTAYSVDALIDRQLVGRWRISIAHRIAACVTELTISIGSNVAGPITWQVCERVCVCYRRAVIWSICDWLMVAIVLSPPTLFTNRLYASSFHLSINDHIHMATSEWVCRV